MCDTAAGASYPFVRLLCGFSTVLLRPGVTPVMHVTYIGGSKLEYDNQTRRYFQRITPIRTSIGVIPTPCYFNPLNAQLSLICPLHYSELTIFSTLAGKGLRYI